MMYDKIVNPLTGRYVSVLGPIGKKILKNYIENLYGGSLPIGREPSLGSILQTQQGIEDYLEASNWERLGLRPAVVEKAKADITDGTRRVASNEYPTDVAHYQQQLDIEAMNDLIESEDTKSIRDELEDLIEQSVTNTEKYFKEIPYTTPSKYLLGAKGGQWGTHIHLVSQWHLKFAGSKIDFHLSTMNRIDDFLSVIEKILDTAIEAAGRGGFVLGEKEEIDKNNASNFNRVLYFALDLLENLKKDPRFVRHDIADSLLINLHMNTLEGRDEKKRYPKLAYDVSKKRLENNKYNNCKTPAVKCDEATIKQGNAQFLRFFKNSGRKLINDVVKQQYCKFNGCDKCDYDTCSDYTHLNPNVRRLYDTEIVRKYESKPELADSDWKAAVLAVRKADIIKIINGDVTKAKLEDLIKYTNEKHLSRTKLAGKNREDVAKDAKRIIRACNYDQMEEHYENIINILSV